MKRTIMLSLSLLMALCVASQTRIENPDVDYYNNYLRITAVEMTPEFTKLHVYLMHKPNWWVKIGSEEYLQDAAGERKYRLLKSEGFELDKEVYMPESGKKEGILYFEPVAEGTECIDFVESLERPDANVFGIHLTAPYRILPNDLMGTWYATDGSGRCRLAFTKKKVLYGTEAWDYGEVRRKGRNYEIDIESNGLGRTLYVALQKEGALLLKKNRKERGELLEKTPHYRAADNAGEWSFTPSRYADGAFAKGGVAVVNGYIENYSPKLQSSTIKIVTYNEITDDDINTLAQIAEDGTFSVNIQVAYPQYCFWSFPSAEFYLNPNDTLFFHVNTADNNDKDPLNEDAAFCFMGNGDGAVINRFADTVKNRIVEVERNSYTERREAVKNGRDAVLRYRDGKIATMEKAVKESSELLKDLPLTAKQKDLLVTNVMTSAFVDIIDVQCDYYDTRTIIIEKEGQYIYEPNKDYVEIDWKEFYRSLAPYYPYLLDNALMLSSNSTWVVFNRVEFCKLFFDALYGYQNDKDLMRGLLKEVISTYDTVLPDSTRASLNESCESLAFKTADPLCMKIMDEFYNLMEVKKNRYYEKAIKDLKTNFDIDPGFLFQISLIRSFFKGSDEWGDDIREGKLDILTDNVAVASAYMNSSFLRRRMIDGYRKIVAREEGGGEEKANPAADALFEKLIAPYKGNVLYLDFWGLGCGPCRSGMIQQRDLVEKMKDHAVKFLYICNAAESPKEASEEFLVTNNIKGEQIRLKTDEWNLISNKFGIFGIPHAVLVDKSGKVRQNGGVYVGEELLLELEEE